MNGIESIHTSFFQDLSFSIFVKMRYMNIELAWYHATLIRPLDILNDLEGHISPLVTDTVKFEPHPTKKGVYYRMTKFENLFI